MKRNYEALGWPAVLALALAAPAAARAQAPDGPRPGAARAATKSRAEIERELEQLRNDTSGSFRAAQKAIEALREEVGRLRKEVEALRSQPVTRGARYAPAASGRIRLVNTYSEPVRIIVNGTTYRLGPGETRLLRDQPAGAFTYEVVGVRAPVSRVLAANQTFRIHIHPGGAE